MKTFISSLIIVLTFAFMFQTTAFPQSLQSMVNLEKRYLEDNYERAMARCQDAPNRKDCRKNAVRRFEDGLARLESDPELYFYRKDKNENRSRKYQDNTEVDKAEVKREARKMINNGTY